MSHETRRWTVWEVLTGVLGGVVALLWASLALELALADSLVMSGRASAVCVCCVIAGVALGIGVRVFWEPSYERTRRRAEQQGQIALGQATEWLTALLFLNFAVWRVGNRSLDAVDWLTLVITSLGAGVVALFALMPKGQPLSRVPAIQREGWLPRV